MGRYKDLNIWLTSGLLVSAGIALAAAVAGPSAFWASVGFMIASVSLGIGIAVLVVPRILDVRQAYLDAKVKRRVLDYIVVMGCITTIELALL